jgi:ribosomal protein S18 acetylase RimI-like enzyme
MQILPVTARHRDALVDFVSRIPPEDRGFFDRSLLSQVAVASWTQAVPERRLVAIDDDGDVHGLVTIAPGSGWMSHVGELRLVVAPASRGRGVGHSLAVQALELAATMDLRKVTVEVMATNTRTQAMFSTLDFAEEARLVGQVLDGAGGLQDIVVLVRWLDPR